MAQPVTVGVDAGFTRLRVAALDPLTVDSVAITFDVPPEHVETFRFEPGQHLTLRHVAEGQDLRRTYSVCASAAGGPLRVAVKRLEGGALSTWLTTELRPGDVVEVLPPAGRFGPRPNARRTRRYGLIAAGSGITPVLSIAATVLDVEPASTVVLIYGNRTQESVMFLEELADLKDRWPQRLELVHVLSREEQESEMLSGRLDRERLVRLLNTLVSVDGVDDWYLCGPFGVVADGRDALLAAGVDPSQVHTELFHADPAPPRPPHPAGQSAGTSNVFAKLHGRTTTIAVERDGPAILDVLLTVRPDAPYACKGGVCGTCRAQVNEGSVEMDLNYALEADELAAGVVLTCQSHPTTSDVRLTYL